MSGPAQLDPREILATLRELSEGVRAPLWLFGGVAVDFLVGRWTRPHGDIDLNAWAHDRTSIAEDLDRLGYENVDTGWLTHWRQPATGRAVEIAFLQRNAQGEAEVVIQAGDAVGTTGPHPMVPGYLDPGRWAKIGDVRFRVSHPLGELRARLEGSRVIAGRPPDPKIDHDRRLLEDLLGVGSGRVRTGPPGAFPGRQPG